MNFKSRKNDQFKGHKGKILRKKLYGAKRTNRNVIDEEIQQLHERLNQVNMACLSELCSDTNNFRTVEAMCPYR